MERRVQIWLIAIFVVAITAVVVVAAVMSQGVAGAVPFTGSTTTAVDEVDHVRGPATAKVTVIEYGDFQCPACGAWEPIVRQLMTDYPNDVRVAFRNFPLRQIHPNAQIASQAAEAAGLQGKYWEMHDILYAKQNEWTNELASAVVDAYFAPYAGSLGLDVERFKTDIQSDVIKQRVERDVTLGNDARVDHTPTFFINGTEIQNPRDYAAFKSIIDAAIASSTAQQ